LVRATLSASRRFGFKEETMTSFTRLRRTAIFVVTLLAVLALWAAPASAIPAPKVMAALGDSITRAYNSAGTEFTPGTCPMLRGGNVFDLDCPPNSWSTGTNPAVNSQFQRIQAIDPDRNPVAYNDAVSGARASGLNNQAQTAATQDPDYVTIEIGGNDACRSSIAAQTPTATFRSQVETALDTLVATEPAVHIEMLSIPDINQLHTIFTSPPDPDALMRWSAFGTCQALLANPLSMGPADVDRRAQFRAQVIAYNGALADVCAEFKRCLFDNNAVFNSSFRAANVATVTNTAGLPGLDFWDSIRVFDPDGYDGSTADYFHPSLQGQAQLAEISWNATFPMH
jgi:lysophospholipase L1-like esterase